MTTPSFLRNVTETVVREAVLERRHDRVTLLYYRLAQDPPDKKERMLLAERLEFAHWMVETGRIDEWEKEVAG